MDLQLYRTFSGETSTVGIFCISGKPFCYTCEDEHRLEKVHGETRIPAGRYEIKYRDEGGMVKRYKAKYSWHKGMLHLQNVPGFTYIYIHTGNTEADTEGCILVGNGTLLNSGGGTVLSSRVAYHPLYIRISKVLDAGGSAFIDIYDSMNNQQKQIQEGQW